MIKLTGVVKRYRGRSVTANAVDGIDLHIPEGKLVTLLGPSGCGKTTTLRLIAGFVEPSAGEIAVGERVVSSAGLNIETLCTGTGRQSSGVRYYFRTESVKHVRGKLKRTKKRRLA